MSYSAEPIDKLAAVVDMMFDDPAFGSLKTRDAAFALVRASDGKLLWVNNSAAAFWGTRDLGALGRNLAGQFGPGSGLEGLLRGTTLWAPPRLGRLRLALALRLRNHIMLFRTGTGADGEVLMGFALPETAADEDRPPDAWRHGSDEPDRIGGNAPATRDTRDPNPEPANGSEGDGLSLARRSQIAVLRDRLQAAADGAGSLRLLWRTDAADVVTQIDAETFARLGTPVAVHHDRLVTLIGAWDPEVGDRLAAALATRSTWSGITVLLPVADGVASVPMVLSASPIFAPGRSFSGFRGFGAIDLTRLELASNRERPARDGDRPADETQGADPEMPRAEGGGEETGREPKADLASLEQQSDAGNDEPAAVQPEEMPLHRDMPRTTLPAPEPDRALSSANVVHLRPFQTGSAGRFGAVPHKDPTDDAILAEAPVEELSPQTSEATEDQDDEAFRALRDALLAQIPPDPTTLSDAGPHHGPEVHGASGDPDIVRDSDPTPASSETIDASLIGENEAPVAVDLAPQPVATEPSPGIDLIDDLPVGVLVIGAGLPLFANPAAASRLGYAGVADLIGQAQHLVVSELSTADTGTLVLRDADDRAVAIPAERRDIDWRGGAAVLWTIGGLPTAESRAASPIGAAGEGPDPREQGSRELLDRVDDAVALLDVDGRIRRLNRRGETWFTRFGHESARRGCVYAAACARQPCGRAGAPR